MDKYYTVNIGSNAPVYFDSAYTGGTASAKFNGTVVIYTKSEGFEDAGNAAGATAQMISSDFGSGLMTVLNECYAKDSSANPNEYTPDKNELITAVNEYAIKNGYGIMNIDFINVEVTAEKVIDTATDIATDVTKEPEAATTLDVAQPIMPKEVKKEVSIAPILAIVFGVLLLISVVVIVILAKGNRGKSNSATPTTPETPVEPKKKEETKPEENKE